MRPLSPRCIKRTRFHCTQGFATRRLAHMLHSLVRVSRRVRWDRLGASDLNAHCDCTATPTSRSAGTASSPHRSDAVMAAVRPCGLRCSAEGRHSPQSPVRRTQGARTETRRARPPAPQGTWRTINAQSERSTVRSCQWFCSASWPLKAPHQFSSLDKKTMASRPSAETLR